MQLLSRVCRAEREGLRKDHGGRHEMLNEINRAEVLNNLLGWLAGLLEEQEVSRNGRKLA